MNLSVKKLYTIGGKKERKIIGLMSGTSLDGLDIALCICKGSGLDTDIKILKFLTVPYEKAFKDDVKSIFSKREADLQKICLLNALIGTIHGEMILKTLKAWNIEPQEVDLIASHGQTIYHAPKSLHGLADYPNATLQIGDGDHIAVKTGIITVSDFRQKHVAAGGEGAPLAVYGDYLLFSKLGENRIMLNIGGISNFTYLPGDLGFSEMFSTDIGPGNTLIDQYIQKYYSGLQYDENARLAKTGKINQELLGALLLHPFLDLPLPKTTGPELFNLDYLQKAQEISETLQLKNEDILATLCLFTSQVIVNALKSGFEQKELTVYVSGGGMHNPLIMQHLKDLLPNLHFYTTAELNINPDAKEAVLFALLANESVAGGDVNFGSSRKLPSVCMGKISMPN
ncbi:MAG: anhydro-N-acetylmuramic acid kinase [Sphingobacteriales bacterium]|nr:anhydro-N-acetylmuramic acid kinase [Sphingobacteriales bacterium]